MLSKNNKNRLFTQYNKTAMRISDKIIDYQVTCGSEDIFDMRYLMEFSSDSINEFTSFYMSKIEDLNIGLINEDVFRCELENIFRERMLYLGLEGDFIPDENLIRYCCRETVELMYLTNKMRKQDENNDDYPQEDF